MLVAGCLLKFEIEVLASLGYHMLVEFCIWMIRSHIWRSGRVICSFIRSWIGFLCRPAGLFLTMRPRNHFNLMINRLFLDVQILYMHAKRYLPHVLQAVVHHHPRPRSIYNQWIQLFGRIDAIAFVSIVALTHFVIQHELLHHALVGVFAVAQCSRSEGPLGLQQIPCNDHAVAGGTVGCSDIGVGPQEVLVVLDVAESRRLPRQVVGCQLKAHACCGGWCDCLESLSAGDVRRVPQVVL